MILTREDAFRVVFNIRTPEGDKLHVGTGLFFIKNSQDIYILTARHVAEKTNQDTHIILGDDLGNSIKLNLLDLTPKIDWKNHPNADISIMKIMLTKENMKYMKGRFFPYENFHIDKKCVSRDSELTTIGFPLGLGIDNQFSPFTFRSYASSALIKSLIPNTRIVSEFFYLENPSIGGYSGAPVFDLGHMVVGSMISTKEKTVCYGFISGTLFDETGGKAALVTPAFFLLDFFQ